MNTTSKLKRAIRAIEDAKRSLSRVSKIEESRSDVRRAIHDLEDAENYIRKAKREVD